MSLEDGILERTEPPAGEPEINPPPPVTLAPDERIPALDLIRGVTILGILLINISFFSQPTEWFEPQVRSTWWGDYLVRALSHAFVEGKMMSQLAILFGMGLAIQADRAQATGRPFAGYYFRRQVLLFVIGLTHALCLWYGDILASYALVGLLALVLSKLGQRGVLGFMAGCLIWVYGWVLLFALLGALFAASAGGEQSSGRGSPEQAFRDMPVLRDYLGKNNELRIYQTGSWPEMVVNRALNTAFYFFIFAFLFGWYYLACFLLGIYLVRRGVFYDPERHRLFLRRLTWVALGIGVPINLCSLVLSLLDSLTRSAPEKKELLGGLAELCSMVGMLPMAVGYLGLLVAWSRSRLALKLQGVLRSVGRMALTNYLMQSVLCGFVFYSYGLAWFGQLGPAAALLVVFGIWLLELIWSPIWLKYFQMGPVEWAWRSLADLRVRPFLHRA